ncbi:hypothetical protein [Candidatus Kuenenia stuttgartiensis]|uniref:hypothetical protein n=1 Tax=Kuenenia stuttgartiensis TaxID=174633 RepID=UPI001E2A6F11|nr:hypothetical protein [Candidatus Kuenenia stuttgartiensis]
MDTHCKYACRDGEGIKTIRRIAAPGAGLIKECKEIVFQTSSVIEPSFAHVFRKLAKKRSVISIVVPEGKSTRRNSAQRVSLAIRQ